MSTDDHKKKVLDFIHEVTFSILSELSQSKMPRLLIAWKCADKKFTEVNISSPGRAMKLSFYLKTLSIIHNLVQNDQYATKRDIYYQYKHLFQTQAKLDFFILNLARTINVPRHAFNIITSAKGLIAGDLAISMNDGSTIDCNAIKHGVLVPSCVSHIKNLESSAQFTLIVEKDATFQRLIDDGFNLKYSAILITGKGEPDINTRELAHLLYEKFPSMHFYCLTDANPYGICIMSVYKYGSKVDEQKTIKNFEARAITN